MAPSNQRQLSIMLAVFCSIGCQLAALVCLKLVAHETGAGYSLLSVVQNPWFFIAFICLSFQALAWQLALRKYPLAYIYPFNGLVYPGVLIVAHLAFNEPVTASNIVGAMLIVAGIWVMKK